MIAPSPKNQRKLATERIVVRHPVVVVVSSLVLGGCYASVGHGLGHDTSDTAGSETSETSESAVETSESTDESTAGSTETGSDATDGPTDSSTEDSESAETTSGPDLVEQLLGLTEGCEEVVGSDFASDFGAPEDISICALEGAVYWRADMDIDCDGTPTAECNADTDPWFQPITSMGDHIAASELPFVVIPLPSWRFDYTEHDIDLGNVVAVIYEGELRYGAFVDQGPVEIIGEASYAMAELFGIDPDPEFGGSPGPVTYIAFTGDSAVVPAVDILDHGLAESIGAARAQALIADNG